MATSKGGFDCEFITAPPRSLECPVCLLTVREPHIISCCGNQFCRTCIQQILNDSKPCPLCSEPNFTTFLHKGVMREVNSLMVRCPQKEVGCDWKGELGQLQQHINPGVKIQGKGCGFVLFDCVYKCGEQFPRTEIQEHELEECLQRPIEVQISSLARKLKGAVVENQFLKKDFSEKLNIVIAENQAIRAVNQAIRAENQAIRAENQATKAAVLENQFLNKELSEKLVAVVAENQTIKAENKALQGRVKQLQSSCALLESCFTPTPPFYFTLNNVKHYMQEDLKWWSPPFYSHAGGYKLHFGIHPNGFGSAKGTHLSLFVSIMQGEYDDQLQWPFRGNVTIQMLESETWGNTTTISFAGASQKCAKRPVDRISSHAFGFFEFIMHDKLQIYCREDKICFRVSSVEL